MSDLSFWKNEIADMPTQTTDGSWYDLETGSKYTRSQEFSEPTCNIKGSYKQVQWARAIRSKFIDLAISRNDHLKDILLSECDAKFWIDNRDNINIFEIEIDIAEQIKRKIDAKKTRAKSKRTAAKLAKQIEKEIAEIKSKDWKSLTQDEKKTSICTHFKIK